jgi:hypothetical protein
MNALLLNRKVFTIDKRNVRDQIIKTVRTQMPGTPFAKPLIEHLEKCGKRAFDKYVDLELILKEYNVVLRFRATGTEDGEAMAYTLDSLTGAEPNEAFARKWTDVFRF